MFTYVGRRRGVVVSTVLGLVAAPLTVGFAAPAQANIAGSNLVIAEVYGGGGSTSPSASYKQDFVELYNPTNAPISLNGWSIQYRSATGSAANAVALPNKVVPANDRFLIGMGAVSTGGADLPATDATASTLNMAAASALIVLSNGASALTVPTGNIPAGTTGVVDAVGYGPTVTSFETARQATAGATNMSYARSATGADTDNNSADLSVGTPTPQAATGNTSPATALAATNPGDKTATVGTAITGFTLGATGGTAPYTWTATGLPAGVTVAPNGTVSGSPTAAGTYDVTATATDSGTPTAATATTSFTITVAPGPVAVQILATNDFHGRIQNDTTAATAGAAVLAGAVKQLRTVNPNTVFAAAGDMIGASTFESFIAKDKPTIDALNEAGLEVSAAGNHEFDQGYNDLVNRVMAPYNADTNPYGGANWKYLGANVKFKADDSGALDGTWMKTMDGVQVGFIGAVTEHLPELVSPGGISTIKVTDTATAANAAAKDLKAAGADVVVLLVHEGAAGTDCSTINTDTTSDFGKITSAVDDDVDAIVSGHTHLSYNCSQTVPGWVASGRSVTTRPIVSAGQYGMGLNQISYTVDPASGDVQSKSQALLPLKNGTTGSTFNYPVDSATQTIVNNASSNADVLGAAPLGKIRGTFNRAKLADGTTENRGGESTLGNMVAEIQRWATTDPAFGAAQIAFMNPGGLRSDLAGTAGDVPRTVTYKQAANVQPFANTLVNEALTGAQIKAALEQQWQPAGASRPFLKLGISKGFTYTYDPTAAQGSRVRAMYLNGTAIDLSATYSVTVNSFLSTGGDNFTALNGSARKQDTGRTDLQAQVDYFAALGSGANVIPVDNSQRAVGVSLPAGAPASYPAGGDVTVNLSSLSMTGPGDLRDTSVTARINDTVLGTFPVTTTVQTGLPGFDEAGTATAVVTLPGDLASGAHELVITGNQSNTEVKIPFTSDAPASVETTVSGAADPIVYGADGTVAVTVTPSSATGTVQLLDGETVIGTGALADGSTSITVEGTALAVGSHDLTLKYLGDTGFDPSTGTVTVSVVQASTEVGGTSDPITYGQAGAVAVTVSSSGGTPSGEVELRDGETVVGTVTLADGEGTITVPAGALAVGEHTLTLAYLGAASFKPSADTVKVTVVPIETTVSGTADPIVYGTDGTVTVTVTPSTATGTVQLLDGDTVVGTGTLAAGTTSITVDGTDLTVGSHDLTLNYLGDAGFDSSTGTVTVAVTHAPTTVTGSSSPITYGQAGAVAVTVTSPAGTPPTGEVKLRDGDTVVGAVTLADGAGIIAVPANALAVGEHTLTLAYAGPTSFDSSTGTVTVAVLPVATTVSGTAAPIVYGAGGTVAVTVTPSTATGIVRALDGDTVVGTGTLAAGTTRITIDGTALAVGSHDLTLNYLGDTGFGAATGTVTVAATKATPTVAVTAAPSPVRVKTGNNVSVRVQAAGFTPTGQVQILSGNTVVGRGPLSAGSASIDVGPYSRAGTSTLTVNYLGDATTNTGSSSVSVKVLKQTPSVKVTAPKKVKKKAAPTVKVVLTGVGAKVSGKVTFTYNGKTVTKYLKNGKVALKLAKLTKTTTVTVKYAGTTNFHAVTKGVKITVKK